MPSPSSFMTFSRKRVVKNEDITEHQKRAESGQPLDSQANGEGLIRSGHLPSNLTAQTSWQRKTTQGAQSAENQKYITELRTYFQEVDSFELSIEEDCSVSRSCLEPDIGIVQPTEEGWPVTHPRKKYAIGDPIESDVTNQPKATSMLDSNHKATKQAAKVAIEGVDPKISVTPKSLAGRILTTFADAFQRLSIRNNNRSVSVSDGAKHTELSTPLRYPSNPSPDDFATVRKGIITRYQEAVETIDQTGGLELLRAQNDYVSAAIISQVQEINTSKLDELLALCGQQGCGSSLPSMEDLLGENVDVQNARKIGEGTFGEAFKVGNVVLKIVPMNGESLINGEPQKLAQEMSAEVAITLTLSNLCNNEYGNVTSGFVRSSGIGLCRGPYDPTLCTEWHKWNTQFQSENEAVDNFNSNQQYVVFMAADGGIDLEHFEIGSFAELRSVLLQTVLTLAVAEEACQFEHRDLHWGNILIKRDGALAANYKLRGAEITANIHGINVTLIDFTLSRLITDNGDVAYCDLARDPGLFNGPKGNFQAEAYRRMKKATKNSWEASFPVTNCLWMRYMADILMTEKMRDRLTLDDKMELRGFSKRAMGYASCRDMLWDDFFKGHWAV